LLTISLLTDPINDPATREVVEKAKHACPSDMRIFMLVDTGRMEVTTFEARRPPVAFLLAGSEGGLQRAIGVSYHPESATCYRETVLRMETPVLDQMSLIGQVRLGMDRPMAKVRGEFTC
jgi:hypothetical protein